MIINSISLKNFRNYENENIHFYKYLNIIVGYNAQGKTNLLESLIYLSLTRSHRINDEKKLIKKNKTFADIKCNLINEDKNINLEAIIHNKGKSLIVKNNPVKKSSEFIGLLNVVLFSPDDLKIFNDQPRERRRVMNQEITKINVSYLNYLNKFQNLLKERNIILKNKNIDEIYLDTLDKQISLVESKIIEERNKFSTFISSILPTIYKEISMSEDKLNMKYKCCIKNFKKKEENIYLLHKEYRNNDIENKTTTVGIHREDLIFTLNDENITITASQGQKRMTMLAFKMALLKYIENVTNKKPVLLLDDVLSELDIPHQKKLLEMVEKPYQCIITTTEIPQYFKSKDMKIFVIENGKISEKDGGKVIYE